MVSEKIKAVGAIVFLLFWIVVIASLVKNLVLTFSAIVLAIVLLYFISRTYTYESYLIGQKRLERKEVSIPKISYKKTRALSAAVVSFFVLFIENTLYENAFISGGYLLAIFAITTSIGFVVLNLIYSARANKKAIKVN